MKKIILFSLPALLFFGCKKDPQIPPAEKLFTKYYGTSGDETAAAVKELKDGNIIIGATGDGPNGGKDFILLKTDNDGNQKWMNYYGGSGDELCSSFDETSDGGFVLAGSTTSSGAGGADWWIVKTDSSGNMQWSKTYGDAGDDDAMNVRTVPGGYLVCGTRYVGFETNAWVIRLDQNGDSLWSCMYGGNGNDGLVGSCAAPGGGYAVVGYNNSNNTGTTEGMLMLFDDQGALTGLHYFGTTDYDMANGIVPAADGDGWVTTGETGATNNPGAHDVFVCRLSSVGDVTWWKTFGAPGRDAGEAITALRNGTYGIAGFSNGHDGYGQDAYLLEVYDDGSLKTQRYEGTVSTDAAYAIAEGRNTVLLCGSSNGGGFGGNDIYLQRVSE